MTEFHDPDLRQQLGRLSGPYPDDNVAFEQWQRRVGQARRRRAIAWTTATAISLIIGTVTVSALQSPTRRSLVPGKSAETSTEFTVSVASTEAEDSTTAESIVESTVESTVPESSAATTLAPDTTPSTAVETETSLPEPESTASTSSPPDDQSTEPTNGEGDSPTSAVAAPPSATQTFDSAGGSITVRQDGDRLTVVDTTPASGFEPKENDHSGGRVKVTFRSGDHKFEVMVKLVDGVMQPSVSESNDSHQDSSPDTSGGDYGEDPDTLP